MAAKRKTIDARRKRPSDRKLRSDVFYALAEATNEPRQAIEQMQLYVHWIKTGKVLPPKAPRLVSKDGEVVTG